MTPLYAIHSDVYFVTIAVEVIFFILLIWVCRRILKTLDVAMPGINIFTLLMCFFPFDFIEESLGTDLPAMVFLLASLYFLIKIFRPGSQGLPLVKSGLLCGFCLFLSGLIVAYLVGMGIPIKYFSTLQVCKDSTSTGCFTGWRTLRRGYRPSYIRNDRHNSFVTNPLTWETTTMYAPRSLNHGSVLYDYNKIIPHTTDAWIEDEVLWVRRPKFPWSFLYFSKNYHVGDINLFYVNIRQNVALRVKQFLAKNTK